MQKESNLVLACIWKTVFFHSKKILNDLLCTSEEHKSYALFTNFPAMLTFY